MSARCLANSIDLESCNVRLPLTHEENATASPLLEGADLYIISYLLSETRGHWMDFFEQLWQQSTQGTMFLLADPTAWQLHVWIQHMPDATVAWLDSSRHDPALQLLENRVGPAVCLVMKE